MQATMSSSAIETSPCGRSRTRRRCTSRTRTARSGRGGKPPEHARTHACTADTAVVGRCRCRHHHHHHHQRRSRDCRIFRRRTKKGWQNEAGKKKSKGDESAGDEKADTLDRKPSTIQQLCRPSDMYEGVCRIYTDEGTTECSLMRNQAMQKGSSNPYPQKLRPG